MYSTHIGIKNLVYCGCKGQTPVAGRECYAGVSHKSLAIRGPKKKTNQPNHWHNKTRL